MFSNPSPRRWPGSRSILISWIPASETVSQLYFCHSVQAKRDEEPAPDSIRGNPGDMGLVPGFRRFMTALMALSAITTQSLRRNDKNRLFLNFYKSIKGVALSFQLGAWS